MIFLVNCYEQSRWFCATDPILLNPIRSKHLGCDQSWDSCFLTLNTSNITLITHMNITTGADMVCPPNHLFETQHLFRSEIYIGEPQNCVFQLQKHYIMHPHTIWFLIKVCKWGGPQNHPAVLAHYLCVKTNDRSL